MRIAFVCYNSEGKYPIIEEENTLLLKYLQQKGLDIHKEIWSDPAVDWQQYDLAVLKAPWDYFDRFPLFKQWLLRMEQLQVKLLNPVPVVRWNSDKHYLHAIEEAGLHIIPSIFIEKGEKPSLSAYFETFNTDTLIIKPAVSGGAKNTILLTRDTLEAISPGILKLLEEESFMVQPFIREIISEGEWSLLFFGGQYSHCILKTAATGDFRVQHIHGGSVHPMEAPAALRELAQQYIDKFAKDCLYARVDGVMIDGQFALMELELIEPYLYLFTHQQGYENYYQALAAMV
jgi:glutathione synthase/RimK-type ligase-like ATP-grasp enzyme